MACLARSDALVDADSTTLSYTTTKCLSKQLLGQLQLPTAAPCSQLQSPFFQLPAELRIAIYTYVLGGLNWYFTYSSTWCLENDVRQHTLSYGTFAPTSPRPKIALLGTCRQVYSEAATLLFSLNAFHLDSHCAMKHFLEGPWFVKGIPAIRTISFNVYLRTPLKYVGMWSDDADIFALLHRFPNLSKIIVKVANPCIYERCSIDIGLKRIAKSSGEVVKEVKEVLKTFGQVDITGQVMFGSSI